MDYSRLDHFTVDDGISSNRIRCIFRDSKDYLWIGTDVGLDKFNSIQIKTYRNDEKQPGTISNDVLTCIYEDRGKNLWFGTYNGLNLYDHVKDNFIVFKNNQTDSNSINGDCITGITEDKDGNLWVVTNGSCLNMWVPESHKFIRYQFKSEQDYLNPRPSRMIAVDSKGYLWVVSLGKGIYRFDTETGEFVKFDNPAYDFGNFNYKSLYIDNQDIIWIATDGNGLFTYNPETNNFAHFGSNGDGKGTNQNLVLDILPEDDRYLLIAVDQGGINRFDKISQTFEYIKYDQSNSKGLNNNGIWCLYEDREGILWIGTAGGGINLYNPKKERFKLFAHSSDNPNSLSYNFTGCFYEDHLGKIWIGTDGGGVNVYDPETGKYKIYKHDPADPYSIGGNVIRGIAEDKNHDMWFGTWDAGLNRFDRESERFFNYLPDTENQSSISGKTIYNLVIDHNDVLWISIYNIGVDLYDIKKGVIRRFRTNPDTDKSISGDNCWFFFEDPDKKMWMCTENGLDLYDSLTNSVKVINFPDNDIGAFYKDNSGYIWVGSHTKGLYLCDINGTILKTYNKANILPDNRIHAITQDNNGNIWISSNFGISRLNPKTQSIRNYSKEDGLQGDQFYQQSFLKTRSGEMYFGGYNGFNSFDPNKLKDNDFITPVYVTDFQIFNKPVEYGVPGSQFPEHISEAKEITLKWDQSVFSFSFVAINYTFPGKNQYAYKMQGFENDWNYTDASRRYVTYTNLDPGEYIFKVKATNNDGVWNDQGASLRIIILSPWWETLGFRIGMILILVSIVLSIILSRFRQLKNQKILLEQTVEAKTKELNELNASKDKYFSIIAHDLKNPFNTLIGFSEVLKDSIDSDDTEMIKDSANIINKTAIQTFNLLENLLQWSKSQSGKILFRPETLNLKDLCDEEFSILNEMAKSKNIELKCNFTHDMAITADKYMIRTVLRNLVSNAIKFTRNGGMVDVKGIVDNNHFEISVSDSGIGISDETIKKLFRIDSDLATIGTENEKGTGLGLILCKEFVEKHNGRIWVESEEGKGSVFHFTIPA